MSKFERHVEMVIEQEPVVSTEQKQIFLDTICKTS